MVERILQGDCAKMLKLLEDKTVDTCVTSPPYYGLRDYGVGGQIGLEETPEEYIGRLVEVFREVRRVLKDDGTLWLNIGDSYAGNVSRTSTGRAGLGLERDGIYKRTGGKPKDLIGIPWLLAFALRDDGWYLRQDIIWHKPNPMPESVKDRCTKAHEYIFLLSKKAHYYFDYEAIQEDAICKDDKRNGEGRIAYEGKRTEGDDRHAQQSFVTVNDKRNKRDVWTVPPKPVMEAHFATYPEELIEPCILAGSRAGGG
jgi:site-specific DNA-methyltransferase (adenine-specific)